jgi:penicillin-binding protein 1A
MAKHTLSAPVRKSKKKKKSTTNPLWSLIKLGFVLCIWAGFALGLLTLWYAKDLPSIAQQADFERKTSITFLDRHGDIITRYGGLQGDYIAVFDLKPHTVHAILSTEDRRFYSHFGVDPIGILRAALSNVIARKTVQGGSTLTQQLAKNLFLSHERSLKRKIQEVLLAFWLEKNFTKDEILTAYVNRVYFGSGAYGIDAAARTYFNKSAKDLTLEESALIAGLLKAPSRYSPQNNPTLAKQRTQTVLLAMADAGYITQEDTKRTLSLPNPFAKPKENLHTERYFTDWLMDQIPELIGGVNENITVTTTLDLSLQKKAEDILVAKQGTMTERQVDQAAILLTNYDGEVLTMIGGSNYSKSQFNRAVQAKRQAGSAFKPLVYLTAFSQGYRPQDMILDAPITDGSYNPQNYKNSYAGEVTLSQALIESLNTPAVRLIKTVGISNVISIAKALGIESDLKVEPGLALGSSEVTLSEIVEAYATIARKGKRIESFGLVSIDTEEGENLYTHKNRVRNLGLKSTPFLDVTALMENVIESGTGQGAKLPFPAAGKTGTTQNYKDAWFIGFTSDYVAGVWTGNDNNSAMKGVTGGSLPAQLWRDTMREAHAGQPGNLLGGSLIDRTQSLFRNILDQFSETETIDNNNGGAELNLNP